jgi:hypothetical protein
MRVKTCHVCFNQLNGCGGGLTILNEFEHGHGHELPQKRQKYLGFIFLSEIFLSAVSL